MIAAEKVDSEFDEDKIAIPMTPVEVNLPELPPAFSYILELFYFAGQAKSTGMGLVPLDWNDLRAWRKENKLKLTLWERETIKKMSDAYCAESSRAIDPARPAPYMPEVDEDVEVDKIAVAMNIRDGLAAFRGSQRK